MAWTGIKVIHDDMRRSTDYVQDPKKTMLENSVDYVFNRDKTETTLFESATGKSGELQCDYPIQTAAGIKSCCRFSVVCR